ncbi:Tubulin polyglutamylase ttll-4 [Diplonema papillatum]|nr:Tubulin polyglutamylase ttll-4 [Diplonema papillatum]
MDIEDELQLPDDEPTSCDEAEDSESCASEVGWAAQDGVVVGSALAAAAGAQPEREEAQALRALAPYLACPSAAESMTLSSLFAAAAVALSAVATQVVYRKFSPDAVRFFINKTSYPQHRLDTVRFVCPSEDTSHAAVLGLNKRSKNKLVTFRVHRAVRHSCVLGAFARAGVQETKKDQWNVYWGKRLKDEEYLKVNKYQRINHFPGTWKIGRKDMLLRGMHAMRRKHGDAFEITPQSFLLPYDLALLLNAMAAENGKATFIVKPPASSCGRGIFLINAPSSVPRSLEPTVVQRYLPNPLLIDGFKNDLRLYAAVTSFNPLRVYLFTDGLVRFATERYKKGDTHLSKRLMHLTNYSVNRKSTNFKKSKGENDDSSSKWSLRGLRRHFAANGWAWEPVWAQIQDVVVKTLLTCEDSVVSKLAMFTNGRSCCFEMYGFDVILTSNFVPKLLEVNVMPALSCASPVDKNVKNRMVSQLLNLVGIQPYDRARFEKSEDLRKKKRLLGFASGINPRAAAAADSADQPGEQAAPRQGVGKRAKAGRAGGGLTEKAGKTPPAGSRHVGEGPRRGCCAAESAGEGGAEEAEAGLTDSTPTNSVSIDTRCFPEAAADQNQPEAGNFASADLRGLPAEQAEATPSRVPKQSAAASGNPGSPGGGQDEASGLARPKESVEASDHFSEEQEAAAPGHSKKSAAEAPNSFPEEEAAALGHSKKSAARKQGKRDSEATPAEPGKQQQQQQGCAAKKRHAGGTGPSALSPKAARDQPQTQPATSAFPTSSFAPTKGGRPGGGGAGDRSLVGLPSSFFAPATPNQQQQQQHEGSGGWPASAAELVAGLPAADKDLIREAEDELSRCCDFERIFPTPSSHKKYDAFFTCQRRGNAVLSLWEAEKTRCAGLPRGLQPLHDWLADGTCPYPFPAQAKGGADGERGGKPSAAFRTARGARSKGDEAARRRLHEAKPKAAGPVNEVSAHRSKRASVQNPGKAGLRRQPGADSTEWSEFTRNRFKWDRPSEVEWSSASPADQWGNACNEDDDDDDNGSQSGSEGTGGSSNAARDKGRTFDLATGESAGEGGVPRRGGFGWGEEPKQDLFKEQPPRQAQPLVFPLREARNPITHHSDVKDTRHRLSQTHPPPPHARPSTVAKDAPSRQRPANPASPSHFKTTRTLSNPPPPLNLHHPTSAPPKNPRAAAQRATRTDPSLHVQTHPITHRTDPRDFSHLASPPLREKARPATRLPVPTGSRPGAESERNRQLYRAGASPPAPPTCLSKTAADLSAEAAGQAPAAHASRCFSAHAVRRPRACSQTGALASTTRDSRQAPRGSLDLTVGHFAGKTAVEAALQRPRFADRWQAPALDVDRSTVFTLNGCRLQDRTTID